MGLILEARGAGFAYGGGTPVFSGLDMHVRQGELFCILGQNGAGKSTLLKCLAGLSKVSLGEILLKGRDLASYSRAGAARIIAYVPQSHHEVFAFTVFDVVLMGRVPHLGLFSSPGAKDREIARRAMQEMGVAHLADKPYTEISGGERQLTLFARILAQEPQVLLLDEPTSHLDFGNQVQALALIRKLADQGMAVVMTTHFPDHAFLVQGQAAILSQGRFTAQGPPLEALSEEGLSQAYRTRVRLVDVQGYGRICVPQSEAFGKQSHGSKGDAP